MTTSSPWRSALLALAAGAALATFADPAARAGEGPPFGNGKVTSVLVAVDGEADIDDYAGALLAGDTLSVSVVAQGKSALRPVIRLFDPSGADRTPALKTSPNGKSVSFRKFPIDTTGGWTLRVEGGGTQGAYAASFRVKPAPAFGTKKAVLGGGAPRTATHTFEATPGSLVTLTLRPLGKRGEVRLIAVTDPQGESYPLMASAANVRRGVTTLKRYEIVRAPGRYTVHIESPDDAEHPGAAVSYKLDVSVAPPRPKGSRKILAPEPRLTLLPAPQRVAAAVSARLAGHDFSPDPFPRAFVGEREATVLGVAADGTWIDVSIPQLPAPSNQDVVIVNPDGQAHERAGHVRMIPVPAITDVTDAGGVPVRRAPLAGGDSLRIVGSGLDDHTVVRFGATDARVDQVLGDDRLAITSPVMQRSDVIVTVEDDFGRNSASAFTFLFPYPGWGEGDVGRSPAPTAADDGSAATVVATDLDGGGAPDDLILASPIRSHATAGTGHGTRATFTRIWRGEAGGTLTDATDARMEAGLSLPVPRDLDDWNARDLALGDLDGSPGEELVLAGFGETYGDGSGEGTLYGSFRTVSGLRVLTNDGAGRFALDDALQTPPQRLRPDFAGVDDEGAPHVLLGAFEPERGDPSALALGDLDDDGDLDIVFGRGEGGIRRVRQDLRNADFTADPPVIPAADAAAWDPGVDVHFAYLSGTEIVRNRLGETGKFADSTEASMPVSLGGAPVSFQGPEAPGYHSDDLALADLDGDGDLDLVLTWHDPTTVSVRGLMSRLGEAYRGIDEPVSLDGPRIATRVLLNDGAGHFTDATDAWMPAGSGAEFWQAHRLELTDLNGDARPDLVLLHRDGLAAWTSGALSPITITADAATTTPGDLSPGESESWSFVVPADSRCVIETTLGTLPDSVVALHGPSPSAAFVESDDDGAIGAASRIVRDLAAGTWTVRVTGFLPADAGSYQISVRARADSPAPVSRSRSALRVLLQDPGTGAFLDVTTTTLPSLPDGDDFRGGALLVADADGDGRRDLLVGTTHELKDSAGARLRSLRFLRRRASGGWDLAQGELPAVTLDSGEAEGIALLPSPDGHAARSLVLVSRVRPAASQGGRFSRVLDWNR